jgi:hypothetical protein
MVEDNFRRLIDHLLEEARQRPVRAGVSSNSTVSPSPSPHDRSRPLPGRAPFCRWTRPARPAAAPQSKPHSNGERESVCEQVEAYRHETAADELEVSGYNSRWAIDPAAADASDLPQYLRR